MDTEKSPKKAEENLKEQIKVFGIREALKLIRPAFFRFSSAFFGLSSVSSFSGSK